MNEALFLIAAVACGTGLTVGSVLCIATVLGKTIGGYHERKQPEPSEDHWGM